MFGQLLPLPENKRRNPWKDKRELRVKHLRTRKWENIPNQQYDCIGEKYKLISLIRGNKLRLLKCDGKRGSELREDVELSDCTEDLQHAITEWRNAEGMVAYDPVEIGVPRLQSLPTELIWQIAAVIHPKDQTALKMACKRMHSVIPESLSIILYEGYGIVRAMAATSGETEHSSFWDESRRVLDNVGGWDQTPELACENSRCSSW